MPSTRTLSIIGATEESVAHIRLLLRIAGARLQHRWELREGEDVDLMIIEPDDDLATSAIQTRCAATGVPYAILCDQDDVIVHGMALRRPLKLEQLVAVLNAAGAMRPDTEVMPGLNADFYSAEFSEQIPRGRSTVAWDQAEPATPETTDSRARTGKSEAQDAFDLHVRGDPLVEPLPTAPLIDENVTLEPLKGGNTARSALRRDADSTAASLIGVSPLDMEPVVLEALIPSSDQAAKSTGEETSAPLLPKLLRGGALLSPVRISAEGLPAIVLDPKDRRYYSAGTLHELLPFVTADDKDVQRNSIAGTELQRARDSQIPHSFDELLWLAAVATSHGRLDSKLDPGGRYAISHPFAAAPELRSHARITALMTTPMPLHEVARASGARMEEVFDIVNAYAAIGRIEYVPRQSLQSNAPKGVKGSLWRLFSRK